MSLPLFADTPQGRIYVCCKPCIRKVLADVAAAYATAYPATKDVTLEVCPVSGERIGELRETIVLQGVRFALCCAGCVDTARQHAQVVLARVHASRLVDVANETCPVDGRPVEPHAFVVVGDSIVRLSSPRHAADVARSPQALLDKARQIRARQPKPAPHRHRTRTPPAGEPAPADKNPEPRKENP